MYKIVMRGALALAAIWAVTITNAAVAGVICIPCENPPTVVVTETSLGPSMGEYTIDIDSPPALDWYVHAFGVSNDDRIFGPNTADRAGWFGEAYMEASWNTDFAGLTDIFGNLLDYDDLFGTADHVNFYFWGGGGAGPIGPDEFEDGFFFGSAVMSDFAVLGTFGPPPSEPSVGNVIARGSIGTEVPEPATLLLFGTGLLGLSVVI